MTNRFEQMKIGIARAANKDNWYCKLEREDTFRYVNVSSFYYTDTGYEELMNNDIIDIAEPSFGSWHHDFIAEHPKVVATCLETSYKSLVKGMEKNGYYPEFLNERIKMFIARSTWTRNLLMNWGIRGDKIRVVPCAVDLVQYKPNEIKNVTRTCPSFVYAGSYNRNKGIDVLLSQFCKVKSGSLNIIKGEFNYEKIELPDNTDFKVWKWGEVPISVFNVFVHPQSYDVGEPLQFGHPMVWAMACGLPLISLDQGASQTHIVHGWNGFLCETYDDIGRAMKYFIDYPEEIKRMGYNSRRRSEEFYNPQIIEKQYKDIYGEVLK